MSFQCLVQTPALESRASSGQVRPRAAPFGPVGKRAPDWTGAMLRGNAPGDANVDERLASPVHPGALQSPNAPQKLADLLLRKQEQVRNKHAWISERQKVPTRVLSHEYSVVERIHEIPNICYGLSVPVEAVCAELAQNGWLCSF